MLCFREHFHRFVFFRTEAVKMQFLRKNRNIGNPSDVFKKPHIFHKIERSNHFCPFYPFYVTDEYYITEDSFGFYKKVL